MINSSKKYCYRITHIDNLPLIIENGIANKHVAYPIEKYINIGNNEIIDVRSTTHVKIKGYGMLGDYVPFYFTPRSIMLYNILTGYHEPVVKRRNPEEILVIRCLISELIKTEQWFFTDGQANDNLSEHYNDIEYLTSIDWGSIQNSNFSKSDGDYDRARRYQAEFLVHKYVALTNVESLNVFNEASKEKIAEILESYGIEIKINIKPIYFFR